MTHSTETPTRPCPVCGHAVAVGEDRPEEGDLYVCFSCASYLRLGPGLALEETDRDTFYEGTADALVQSVEGARAFILKRKAP